LPAAPSSSLPPALVIRGTRPEVIPATSTTTSPSSCGNIDLYGLEVMIMSRMGLLNKIKPLQKEQ
jgi:hypothetical protein